MQKQAVGWIQCTEWFANLWRSIVLFCFGKYQKKHQFLHLKNISLLMWAFHFCLLEKFWGTINYSSDWILNPVCPPFTQERVKFVLLPILYGYVFRGRAQWEQLLLWNKSIAIIWYFNYLVHPELFSFWPIFIIASLKVSTAIIKRGKK